MEKEARLRIHLFSGLQDHSSAGFSDMLNTFQRIHFHDHTTFSHIYSLAL